MTAPICGACRFFVPDPHPMSTVLTRADQFADPTTGECRRYPPRMVGPSERVTPGYSRVPVPEWPLLEAAAWCGEYAAAGEPQ